MKPLSAVYPFVLFLLPVLPQAQTCDFTEVLITTQLQDWGEEVSWVLVDENGIEQASFQDGVADTDYETSVCIEDGCYTLEAYDAYGDGWNGGSVQIEYGSEVLQYTLADGSEGMYAFGVNTAGCVPMILGCTDPSALNYDPEATVDDGSCLDLQGVLAAQVIDTIFAGGPKDNRINFVVQNRGTGNADNAFSSAEEFSAAFEEDLLVAFTLGSSNEQVPYAQYKSFFNLYAAYWPDAPSDQEWWSFGIIKDMRDALFLPWANEQTGWATWFSTTKFGGGGGAGLERDRRVGDGKMFGMGWETLLHEFGHTMPGLLDEYSSNGLWSGGNCWETPNTTGFTTADDIPWRKWIEPGTPLPTPYTEAYLDKYGAFEGAMTNFFGCHRPTARGCYMGAGGFGEDYGLELCGPCRQRVICFLYQYVQVIENPLPATSTLAVSGNETLTFSADVLQPEPNTQKYEWFLNGKKIAEGVEEVELTFGACDQYELTFAVTDTNEMVRYDPKFEEIYPKPYQEFTWTIEQTDINSYSLDATPTIQAADCTGQANGAVSFDISGGQDPYEVYNQTLGSNPQLAGLPQGDYTFAIVDANGCSVEQAVSIPQDAALKPKICSKKEGDTWDVWVDHPNYPQEELQFIWSNGANTPMISAVPDGSYSVTVTTSAGCSVSESISLLTVDEALAVNHKAFASAAERNSGQIFLEASGGMPPYEVYWEDLTNADVTDTDTDNIIASGTTWGHLPEYAFDNSNQTKWLHAISEEAWVGYQIPGGAVVNMYAITSADDVPARDPKNWLFQGSDDGQAWTTLHEVNNHQFTGRFQQKRFIFSNDTPYTYYRFFVIDNYGDIATQLQELEFIGTRATDDFQPNANVRDQMHRDELPAGAYVYTVKDANGTVYRDTVIIPYANSFTATGLKVIQYSDCEVAIESPDPNYDYYWFPDAEGSRILGAGERFSPPASGNYYVAALDLNANILSRPYQGFAVVLPEAPEVDMDDDNTLQIVDPQVDVEYRWYATEDCSGFLQEGTSYLPQLGTGFYYASAKKQTETVAPIDPATVPGLIVRMDAADLDGDGVVDDPQQETSSLLSWFFTNGNRWSPGSWFAYRSNYQNGLGVVDFATIWFQGLSEGENGYQTILMAYEENPISFPNTAPFTGLSYHLPKHTDESQLFANSAPSSTLDGTTFLNGEIVDPLTTPNPLSFCVLGQRLTEASNQTIQNTDTQWEGKIGELLLWDHALTDEEIKGVSAFLADKWIYTARLESPKTGIFWEAPVQTEELDGPKAVQIYPNPAREAVHIDGLLPGQRLQLLNLTGQVLQSLSVQTSQVILDIHTLPKGVYIIRAVAPDGRLVFSGKVSKL